MLEALDLFGEIPQKLPRKRAKRLLRSHFDPDSTPQQLEFNLEAFLDALPEVEWDKKNIRLLAEMILNRSLEFIRNKKVNSSGFAEELAWFFSDEPGPFSAPACAEMAGMDLDELRTGLDYCLPQSKRDQIRLIDNGTYDNGCNYESAKTVRMPWELRPMYSMA